MLLFALRHRTVPATCAAAIRANVPRGERGGWWRGAIAELYATLDAQHVEPTGPFAGLYAAEVFQEDAGDATLYLPVGDLPRRTSRVERITVPAAKLAIVTHHGGYDDVDVAYTALGEHVVAHELGVDGPIREIYLHDAHTHPNTREWITEIGWPIFCAR